jgi:hypothetical protein
MTIMRQVKSLEANNRVLLPQDRTIYTVSALARDKRNATHWFVQLRWENADQPGAESPAKWIRVNGDDFILLYEIQVVSEKLVNLHRSDSTLIGWLVE